MVGATKRPRQPRRYLLLSLYAIFFLFRFALALLDVPKVRLIERGACEQYYRSHSLLFKVPYAIIPETQCKLSPIQAEVSFVTGWRLSLNALPGLSKVSLRG